MNIPPLKLKPLSIFLDALNDNHAGVLKSLTTLSIPEYTCNRPPGAAGAYVVGGDKKGSMFGYVLPPDGSPTCKEVGCEIENGHCVRTIHAEQRAIALSAFYGIMLAGGTMYSVLKPCYQCSKIIIAAGIKHIYYAGAAYDEERTRKILDNAGVTCEYIDVGLEYGQ